MQEQKREKMKNRKKMISNFLWYRYKFKTIDQTLTVWLIFVYIISIIQFNFNPTSQINFLFFHFVVKCPKMVST